MNKNITIIQTHHQYYLGYKHGLKALIKSRLVRSHLLQVFVIYLIN